MKKIYLITIVIFAGIALLIFARWGSPSNENPAQIPQSSVVSASMLETQINDEGSVTVKITPKLSSEIAFEVTLDTHSEELSADLTQAVTLKDENGKEYKPIRWEGDPPEGHHRDGLLAFGPINPAPKTFRLVVRQIGGIVEREFLWITRP